LIAFALMSVEIWAIRHDREVLDSQHTQDMSAIMQQFRTTFEQGKVLAGQNSTLQSKQEELRKQLLHDIGAKSYEARFLTNQKLKQDLDKITFAINSHAANRAVLTGDLGNKYDLAIGKAKTQEEKDRVSTEKKAMLLAERKEYEEWYRDTITTKMVKLLRSLFISLGEKEKAAESDADLTTNYGLINPDNAQISLRFLQSLTERLVP
jgi:hypothetical protein